MQTIFLPAISNRLGCANQSKFAGKKGLHPPRYPAMLHPPRYPAKRGVGLPHRPGIAREKTLSCGFHLVGDVHMRKKAMATWTIAVLVVGEARNLPHEHGQVAAYGPHARWGSPHREVRFSCSAQMAIRDITCSYSQPYLKITAIKSRVSGGSRCAFFLAPEYPCARLALTQGRASRKRKGHPGTAGMASTVRRRSSLQRCHKPHLRRAAVLVPLEDAGILKHAREDQAHAIANHLVHVCGGKPEVLLGKLRRPVGVR